MRGLAVSPYRTELDGLVALRGPRAAQEALQQMETSDEGATLVRMPEQMGEWLRSRNFDKEN